MTIENKYNVPRETIQKMVNDGVIPCSVVNHYQVYDLFQRYKNECPTCTQNSVLWRVAEERNEPFDRIKKIVYELGKKL